MEEETCILVEVEEVTCTCMVSWVVVVGETYILVEDGSKLVVEEICTYRAS